MIFNFTDNYQFTTKLSLNNTNLEIVKKTKLLGVTLTDDLKWNENTNELVRKANCRMELLRKVASFTSSIKDLRNIYILYIRSILEQSCVVWHSSLTEENKQDLERVQKSAVKIMLGKKYKDYENALELVDLENLSERRETLCLKFAKKCLQNEKTENLFPLNKPTHNMKSRMTEKFKVKFAHTERLKQSSIPYMQRHLNNDINKSKPRFPG